MQNNNGNGNSLNQLPIFKGINFHFWSLKMKTLFKLQELWSSVESGFEDDGIECVEGVLRYSLRILWLMTITSKLMTYFEGFSF